jgi:hypothetical protein
VIRGVGSIKDWGGAPASRGTLGFRKGDLKNFSRKCWRRGGGGVPVVPYRNCTFLTKFFLKTWKFPNKKGTFDVNLEFTATLACTKRALFITKKGTFSPLKKFVPPVPASLYVIYSPRRAVLR